MKQDTKPKVKLTPWSLETAIKTEDEMLGFLEHCIEGGDPQLIADALGLLARKRGMSKIARATGLGREGLYRALSAQGNPELGTIMKVISALGLHLKVERVGV